MRNGLVTLVLVVGTAALLYLFLFNDQKVQSIPYSGSEDSFLTAVAEGRVDKVIQRGERLEVTLRERTLTATVSSSSPSSPASSRHRCART